MKKCTKCGVEKPLSEFSKHKSGKNGIRAQCKLCINFVRSGTCIKKPKRTEEETKNLYKSRAFKRKYGISKEDFYILKFKQNNKCAICQNELENDKKSHMDHCHNSGKLRGVLCTTCNVGLGMFKDSLLLLKSAVKYIKKYSS
jgi:hypothetical protein